MENELMTEQEVEELLGLSRNKLTRLTKQGLPYASLGGDKRVFFRSSVLQWLKNREK